jgi:hypothetical protein
MITLEQLEREVGRRTGPFFIAAQDSGVPTSSTATSALMPILKSSALLGGPENLWLLRRGHLQDGTATPLVITAADRQRLVQAYDPGAGRVIVERNWGTPMYPSEQAEFSHLDPSQEIHVATMAGLRRCFFEDTFGAGVTSGYGDMDLTLQAPWLIAGSQVLRVQYGYVRPEGEAPFNTYMQAGHVMLGGAWGSYAPASVWVTGLRPHWSWVNDTDSTTGPLIDSDELGVDLDYAAAAAHIEAWHLFPRACYAAAAGNLQATQQMAAAEFTRQSLIWGPEPSNRYGFSEVVGLRGTSVVL